MIRPVGKVRSERREVSLGLREGELEIRQVEARGESSRELISEVVISEEYSECLDGLEEFSHAVVLYWPHLAGDEGRKITRVHPAGQEDMPLVGVFATRSPVRPNPVCVTTVEILGRRENVLTVRGLDAVDGSPVIDIKPHHPYFDAPEDARLAGWMNELMGRMADRRREGSS